jgi:hypothetical protein
VFRIEFTQDDFKISFRYLSTLEHCCYRHEIPEQSPFSHIASLGRPDRRHCALRNDPRSLLVVSVIEIVDLATAG